MGILEAISSVAKAVTAAFAHLTKRSELKNAQDVKQAAAAQVKVEAQSKIETAVAKEDVNETRRSISE